MWMSKYMALIYLGNIAYQWVQDEEQRFLFPSEPTQLIVNPLILYVVRCL